MADPAEDTPLTEDEVEQQLQEWMLRRQFIDLEIMVRLERRQGYAEHDQEKIDNARQLLAIIGKIEVDREGKPTLDVGQLDEKIRSSLAENESLQQMLSTCTQEAFGAAINLSTPK